MESPRSNDLTDDSTVHDYLTTPGAVPEDIGTTQAEAFRRTLNGSLYAFSTLIFQYQDLKPGLHDEICTHVERWGEPDLRRLLIQIPREFFKTSVFTRANALWQVCRGYYSGNDEAVVIFNERLENTQKWIRAIKDVVMGSRLFHAVYRDLLPPSIARNDDRSMPRWWKWSDTELLFHRNTLGIPEASITGAGIEAATTGGHWPTMIIDDPISLKHAQSPAEMERAREWVDKHVYLMRPVEEGRSLVVDTPWTYGDINVDLIARYDYKVYRRHSLEDADGHPDVNGESIFPEKLSTVKLRAMHERDPFGFNAQMQCIPKPGRDQSVEASWIRFGQITGSNENPLFIIDREHFDPSIMEVEDQDEPTRHVPLSGMSKLLFWDPAPSKPSDLKREPRARNGLVMEGMDTWGRRFILESVAHRRDPIDSMDLAFRMLERWGCDTVAIEEVAFSALYAPFMRYMEQVDPRYGRRNVHFLRLQPGKEDKHTRIRSRFPLIRAGFYYMNEPETKPLVQELLEYPHGETLDLIDALAYDGRLQRPESRHEVQQREWNEFPHTQDTVTGY